MSKKVLILSTRNSCRSIISEAVLNRYLSGVEAYSSGVKATGKVNPNTMKILQREGIWDEGYHSKALSKIIDIEFDLVITLSDNAMEKCPVFSNKTKVIHVEYEDHDGKNFSFFEQLLKDIKMELIPITRIELAD